MRRRPWDFAVIVFGGLVGVACDRLPVGQLTRATLAMVVAWNLSLYFVTVGWLFMSPFAGETGARRLISRQAVLTSAFATALAAGLHLVLRSESLGLGEQLGAYWTHAFGVFGALCGALQGFIARSSEEFEEA